MRATEMRTAMPSTVRDGGTTLIGLPPRSLNRHDYAERFVGSIKDEYLGPMIFVG
jgi:hypothetical protein